MRDRRLFVGLLEAMIVALCGALLGITILRFVPLPEVFSGRGAHASTDSISDGVTEHSFRQGVTP